MPRQARLDAPGILHHVMGRGIEKRNIFWDNRDRTDFIERLAELGGEKAMDVYAWALLPNHFHLLCKTQAQPLAESMRKMLTGYAVNFNVRHKRHGHLFQNRYKSIVCQEDAYLKELVRYIHLNLFRAGLVADINALNRSPWSGHSALMGYRKRDWQNVGYVLAFFGDGPRKRKEYLRFVLQGIGQGRRPELVGGGLIRSLGGWSEVLALRKRGEKQPSDERILGDGRFVDDILCQVNNPNQDGLRLKQEGIPLSQIAQNVCAVHGISLRELRSGSMRQDVVEARRALSWIGIKEFGFSAAHLARYLGVTNSCVTRIVSSGYCVDVKAYIG